MYIHIFDKQTRRHIRLESPPLELFERCGTDGVVRLELHRLAKWARAIHRKNPQFDLSMILSGVAMGYYLNIDFGEKLRLVWEPETSEVNLKTDLNKGVEDVHTTVLQLLTTNSCLGN